MDEVAVKILGQEFEIIENSSTVVKVPVEQITIQDNVYDVIPSMDSASKSRYDDLVASNSALYTKIDRAVVASDNAIAEVSSTLNITASNLGSSTYLKDKLSAEFTAANTTAKTLVTNEQSSRVSAIEAEAAKRELLRTDFDNNTASVSSTFFSYATKDEAASIAEQKVQSAFVNGTTESTSWFSSKIRTFNDKLNATADVANEAHSAITNDLTGLTAMAGRTTNLYTSVGVNPDGTMNASSGLLRELSARIGDNEVRLISAEGVAAGKFTEWSRANTPAGKTWPYTKEVGMVHYDGDVIYQYFSGSWSDADGLTQDGVSLGLGWKRLDKSANDTANTAKNWAAGASKLVEDPAHPGSVIGWSFASGSGGVNDMEFRADKFKFTTSNGSKTPFSVSSQNIILDSAVQIKGGLTVGEIPAFLGKFSGAPTTESGGYPLTKGDSYENTGDGIVYVWNGSAWKTTKGVDGERGSKQFTYNGNASKSNADTAVSNAGFSPAVTGDIVSFKTGSVAAYYRENNDWSVETAFINGNLLVNGSVTATQIDVNDIFAQNVTATGTITGGTIIGGYGYFETAAVEGFSSQSSPLAADGKNSQVGFQVKGGSQYIAQFVKSAGGSALDITDNGVYPRVKFYGNNGAAFNQGVDIVGVIKDAYNSWELNSSGNFSCSGSIISKGKVWAGSSAAPIADNAIKGYATGSGHSGVYGYSGSSVGVKGFGAGSTGIGVYGESYHGLWGRAGNYGVVGQCTSSTGYGFYANGSGTDYGSFTGAHDAFIDSTISTTLGDIIVMKHILFKNGPNNTSGEVELASVENDKRVFGAVGTATLDKDGLISSVDTPFYQKITDGLDRVAINALGEGLINVCEVGGDILNGDFITTSIVPGKGMLQADDLLHSYTAAKSTDLVVWADETDGKNGCYMTTGSDGIAYKTKMIACTYHCG